MSNASARPWSAVHPGLLLLLACAFATHAAWRAQAPGGASRSADLPEPVRAAVLRLASLDEPTAASRIAMLYLQAYDYRGDNRVSLRELDFDRLLRWLSVILELDPRSQYPLFSAARIYAEVPDPARVRRVLGFIHDRYLEDPERRWPWLAHAALVAKHRLRDLPLARRYAADIDRLTRDPGVPLWAKQMEIFILEDMNELEAARIMLGGLLASGRIEDPAERRFLQQRLRDLEARTGNGSRESPGR